MQYICVTATRDEIRELSFATKWFADLCFTENDRIYRTTELSLQYYLNVAFISYKLTMWDLGESHPAYPLFTAEG